jgi:pyrimidine-nucleoside phosphorylase
MLAIEKSLELRAPGKYRIYALLKERLLEHIYPRWSQGFKEGNDHGPGHIERVLQIVEKLVGANPEAVLGAHELYLTLMAVIYHDVGIIQKRDGHGDLSAAIVLAENQVELTTADKDVISKAVASHSSSKDIREVCAELLDEEPIEGQTVRPKVIAALVRIADELDEDQRRARDFIQDLAAIPDSSRFFWRFCQCISGLDIRQDKLEIIMGVRFEADDIDRFLPEGKDATLLPFVVRFARKLAKINRERRTVNEFLPDELRYGRIRVMVKPLRGHPTWKGPRAFYLDDSDAVEWAFTDAFPELLLDGLDAAVRRAAEIQDTAALLAERPALERFAPAMEFLNPRVRTGFYHQLGRATPSIARPALRSYRVAGGSLEQRGKLRMVDVLLRLHNGVELTEQELRFIVDGVADGSLPDYQTAAFLTAIHLRGMANESVSRLARMIAETPKLLRPNVAAPLVTYHGAGGVCDIMTLLVGPLAAACGLAFLKIATRTVGVYIGTLDRLQAVPGLRVDLDAAAIERQLGSTGLVICAGSAALAPVDRKLYALRDVTATVANLPMIAVSVLSKILAVGTQAAIFHFKLGRGALIEDEDDARTLGRFLVDAAKREGTQIRAVMTHADAPIIDAVGHAIELRRAMELLGDRAQTHDLSRRAVLLCAHLLEMTGRVASLDEGRARAGQALASGAALAKLTEMVAAQGGDPGRLPAARIVRPVLAAGGGFVRRIDAMALGEIALRMGAGRVLATDGVDPAVGIRILRVAGEPLSSGDVLGEVHARSDEGLDEAVERVLAAIEVSPEPPGETRRGDEVIVG